MRKRFALGVLVLVVFAGMVTAEEIIGTILFDPQRDSSGYYTYSIATGENSRIADKRMVMGYAQVGNEANSILSNYLVKGAKIVYENGRYTAGIVTLGEPMRNTMGELFGAQRLIAIIMEDGYYMELTEILDGYTISWYFPYLFWKLDREGRAPK